jgi:hypothetical protein
MIAEQVTISGDFLWLLVVILVCLLIVVVVRRLL